MPRDDLDLALARLDEIIFDTGEASEARVAPRENEGWISAANPNIPAARYQLGETGPSRDVTKTNYGFTIQALEGNADLRTIDAVRLDNPHRRLTALLKRQARSSGDVFFRAGRFHSDALPLTIGDFVTAGATFNQAERTIVTRRMGATGDHWYADAAPSTDLATITLAADEPLPVIVVDVREIAVAIPGDHTLTITLTVSSVARTITLASAGASAVAGTEALREGVYFADFTAPANYSGVALPSTGSATLQWAGTGIATIPDAQRAIDLGVGQYEQTYE